MTRGRAAAAGSSMLGATGGRGCKPLLETIPEEVEIHESIRQRHETRVVVTA
jgi:hypothetical protein